MDWIEVDGVSLRYDVTGTSENTIVLVHEMGGSLETWDYMVPALAKRWRVLRYDTREAGFSEKTGHVPSIATMSDEIAGLLDALDITAPVAIAGCALGGAIAMHFAASYPHHTAVLMAMSPATIVAADLRAATIARADKAAREGMRAVADGILEMAYPLVLRGNADRYRIARARLLGVDPASFAVIYRMLAGTDLTADLPKIRCPTLVMAGAYDQLRTPAHVRMIASQIPGAQFEIIRSLHSGANAGKGGRTDGGAARTYRFLERQCLPDGSLEKLEKRRV
jgi:3-oxoadipate enol-lactonase